MKEEGKKYSETTLTVAVVIVCLIIAGAPLLIMNAFQEKNSPENTVNDFFDDGYSGDYYSAVNATLYHFEGEYDRAREADMLSQFFDQKYYSISIGRLTRIYEKDGVNVSSVEARISDMEETYNITIDDWSALKMNVDIDYKIENMHLVQKMYSLQFLVDGHWYLDILSLSNSPRLWNEYGYDFPEVNVYVRSFQTISGTEYKMELSSTQDPVNITSLTIYVTNLDEPIYNDTRFLFTENMNGSRSTASPWLDMYEGSLHMHDDAFTYVDANMNGIVDDGDYLLIVFDEDVTGSRYSFELCYGSQQMSGVGITMGVDMPST